MTPPAIQAGIARRHNITSKLIARELTRGIEVFCFLITVVFITGFGLATSASTTNAQEPSDGQSGAGKQAALVGQTAEPTTQPAMSAEPVDQEPTSATQPEAWRPLLDEQLSLWEVFTGVPHRTTKIKGFPPSESHDCRKGTPFGLGDPKNVFSVTMVDGKPVLHVTGEMYAGLTSLEEFENYHFSTEFKWGEQKWPPRKEVKRDSGILIHCIGKHGAFWNAWMRCFQCQVQEGDCGDLIQLAGTSCQVKVTPETEDASIPHHSFQGNWRPIGPGVRKWGAKRHGNHEIPGAWNRIDIHTLSGRTVFSVNGHPVMHLKDTRVGKFKAAKPLTRGKIQVQSEASECWYRDMKIRAISKLPPELATHFDDH